MKKLPDTEYEIMSIIWTYDRAVTTSDIYENTGLNNNQLKECRKNKDIKKWFEEHMVKKGLYMA